MKKSRGSTISGRTVSALVVFGPSRPVKGQVNMFSRFTSRSRSAAAHLVLATLAVAVAGLAWLPVEGFCAESSPAWTYVDINAEYQKPASFCLVGGELPTATPLPHVVELAVPASSTPQWVGEVFADNIGADTQLPYKIARRGKMDIYSLTLKKSRLGQVEALVPGLITLSGSNYVVTMSWVAPGPVGTCRIAVTMPPNAEVVKAAEGAQTAVDTAGNKHYYRAVNDVKTGDTVSLTFTYAIPTTTENGTSGTGIPVIWWIIGAGAIVVVVLLVMVLRQNARASG